MRVNLSGLDYSLVRKLGAAHQIIGAIAAQQEQYQRAANHLVAAIC